VYFPHTPNTPTCKWYTPHATGNIVKKRIFPHHAPADSMISPSNANGRRKHDHHSSSHSHTHAHSHANSHSQKQSQSHGHGQRPRGRSRESPKVPSKKPPPPPDPSQPSGSGKLDMSVIANASVCWAGGCFQDINIYKYFHNCLGNLWFLWELALVGAPILVEAPSAEECSQAVLAIMSLIAPITYQGDFRPYFTVYDDDFKHFCDLHDRDELHKKPLLIGVTNPIFKDKIMHRFPNILCLSSTTTILREPSIDALVGGEEKSRGVGQLKKGDSMAEWVDMEKPSSSAVNGNNANGTLAPPAPSATDFVTVLKIKNKNAKKGQKAVITKNRDVNAKRKKDNRIVSQATPSFVPDKDFLSKIVPFPSSDEITLESVALCVFCVAYTRSCTKHTKTKIVPRNMCNK